MRKLFGVFYKIVAEFRQNARGNIAIIFALSSTMVVIGVGAGIDLTRAFYARQKLSQVATLTCQFATRPSAVDSGANVFYATVVNQFALSALTSQNWPVASMPTGGPTGTSATYFTSTGASATTANQAVAGVTELWYNVPTSFLKIVNVSQIRVHAVLNCQQPVSIKPGTVLQKYQTLVSEGFETGHSGYYFTLPNGQVGTQPNPSQTFPATAGYQGDGGNQFYIMGYCLEIDAAGVISASDPQGTHSAELDCDNGNGGAGNSSISTKTYMATGYYELRYNFRSRVYYGNYDPTYICGSTASDVSWANDSGTGFNGQRSNQINVYLDQSNSTGTSAPPTHTTIDGTQQLAGVNLIDMCVHSINWIERSVKIKITTAGYYWLSFAADGHNDSQGGQLDNIRLCVEQCAGMLQDNFPSTWLPQNGVNTVLFEDGFDAPTYTADQYASSPHSKSGNLDKSLGTTVNSSGSCYSPFGTYQTPAGWSCQPANGWSTAPYNEVVIDTQGAYQGAQYLTLDGSNSFSSGSQSTNRLVSKPFLLVPGYYQVSYDYISNVDFKSTANISGTYCISAPSSGLIFQSSVPSITGQIRYASGTTTTDGSTNIVGAFMSHGQLVSTPNVANAPWATSANTTYSAPSLGATTSYTNPDGTLTTTPTVPPDGVTWSNYNANVNNPVIDVCGYADSFRWVPRSVSIKITKTAVYWLTLSSSGGLADGNGPAVDDVKLTALGGPYMSNPPTNPLVSIPVPAPQPLTNYTNNGAFNGFYIVADPFAPPAADQ